MAVQRALISVFDKTGILEFATGLVELGVEIISTGGTAKALSRGQHSCDRHQRRDRFSGDPGWPGQDAASHGPRRAAFQAR